MTVGIGILDGVTLAVLGIGIMAEGLTTDQIKPLAQIRRTEAMGPAALAVETASVEAATMVMDSPPLMPRLQPSEARISRPNSLLPLRVVHRLLRFPLSPSPSPPHRLRSSILHRWCRTPCLPSSLSKRTTHLKEVIYCFFVRFVQHLLLIFISFCIVHNRVTNFSLYQAFLRSAVQQ